MHSFAIFTVFTKILSSEPRWLLVAVSVRLHLVEAGEGDPEGGDSVLGVGKAVLCIVLVYS